MQQARLKSSYVVTWSYQAKLSLTINDGNFTKFAIFVYILRTDIWDIFLLECTFHQIKVVYCRP